MGLEEAKVKFEKIAHALQAAIPEGPAEGAPANQGSEALHGLVSDDVREEAFAAAKELTDDEAFLCVNKLTTRAGVRADLGPAVCTYFSHPFWRDLFARANQSDAAKAKRGG